MRKTPPRRQTRGLIGALALAAASLAAAAPAAPPAPPATRTVGTLELHACAAPKGLCGALARPLDPLGIVPGSVSIYFEFYPHRSAAPAAGTLVAAEGGPGYPTTDWRADYLALFEPLRAERDLVLMDNRGTGRSGAIDCPRLQRDPVLTIGAIAACGALLGRNAPLYSTAYAADDLEAILAALGAGPVDLFGNSYGTFFAQVFAVRHPERLRTLILDGAYPLAGPDIAWAPHYAPAMRNKFDRACERAPECAAVPGSSMEHIAPALKQLRARPFAAVASDFDGVERHFTADVGALATVMFGSAPAEATLRETDAAARAFAAGDRLPLLRLMAEAIADTDSRDATKDPAKFSEGLAAAVSCQDSPQIFDMRLAPEARRAARDRALAERRRSARDTYAPFTFDEYRAMPLDYTFIEQCVAWPSADARHPAAKVVPDDAAFPPVPVLVLSGEFDNMTSMADGAAAAAQFPRARHQIIENGLHVNALPGARSDCAARIVRAFISDPTDEAAAADGARCAAAAPPLRLAPAFVLSQARAAPALAEAGNRAEPAGLVAAGAALATLGDLLPRLAANSSGHGAGLRGGRFTVRTGAGGRREAVLTKLRWAEDLWVSGTLAWTPHRGEAVAQVRFGSKGGPGGKMTARWPEGVAEARARLRGKVAGRALVASAPAP
jgi:pimeloyl-ACP methyl ester carboxylesterase